MVMPMGFERAGEIEGEGDGGGVVLGLGLAGDDERGAGLVDQHAVGFIDQREVEATQAQLAHPGFGRGERVEAQAQVAGFLAEHHAIAQVVEGEFLVGAVGDVAVIGALALGQLHALDDGADGKPHRLVERHDQLGVALGEVVVDGHDVHGRAGECHGRGGESGGEGLALARRHLGDHAGKNRVGADELDIVMALAAKRTAGNLAQVGEAVGDGGLVLEVGAADLDSGLARCCDQLAHGHFEQGRRDGVDQRHQAEQLLAAALRQWRDDAGLDGVECDVELALLGVGPFGIELQRRGPAAHRGRGLRAGDGADEAHVATSGSRIGARMASS
jgi:hypothetical protein